MSKAQLQWYVRSSVEALANIKQVPLWKEGLLPEVGMHHDASPAIFASVLGDDQERSRPLRESLSFSSRRNFHMEHVNSCKLHLHICALLVSYRFLVYLFLTSGWPGSGHLRWWSSEMVLYGEEDVAEMRGGCTGDWQFPNCPPDIWTKGSQI